MMTHSSDAAALIPPVSLNTKDIQIETLEVDFPESSERDASIFGNGANNIPIRIRFKFLDKSNNNKNISESLKANVFLYDISSNKGIGFSHADADFWVLPEKTPTTLGFYGKNHAAPTDVGASDISEIVCYVGVEKAYSSQKDFKLGAYLSLTKSPTPDSDCISSGDKKSVNLTVLPKIDYGNGAAWKIEKEGSEGLALSGNIETHGFSESNVSGKSTTWQLTHRMLQDNSPIRLRYVNSASVGGRNEMQASYCVAASGLTQVKPGNGNNETTYNEWVAPEAGHGVTIRPYLASSDDGKVRVSSRNTISVLPASHRLNQYTQALSLVQITMTVTSDQLNVTAYNHQGSLIIYDNIGHNQTVRVAGHGEDGKPVISRY